MADPAINESSIHLMPDHQLLPFWMLGEGQPVGIAVDAQMVTNGYQSYPSINGIKWYPSMIVMI